MPAKYTPEQRIAIFWSRVDKSGGDDACWIWTAARNRCGYGTLGAWEGRSSLAHRWLYEHYVDHIPVGICVLHRCDNPACVNPAHLFLGTHAENMQDMVRKNRHWTTTKPEKRATSTRNGSVVHPERLPRGVQKRNAKLTDDKVRELRQRYQEGVSISYLASEAGINRSVADKAIHRKTWKHVD